MRAEGMAGARAGGWEGASAVKEGWVRVAAAG